MRIAVIGASGYVGSLLARRLVGEGHEVVAFGRRSARLPAGDHIERVEADLEDTDRLADQLEGCDQAYYLVHSLAGGDDFEERDRVLGDSFAKAAAAAGIGRIVYLGGLGRGKLSPHLASRQEVGRTLAASGIDVVELRAAVILGSGSISFEMLRYLTERLPVMICPRWIRTRIQPIAERDLLDHMVRAGDAEVPAGVYEIAGPEVTTYRDMIAAYTRARGLPPRRILDVPVLTPSLSARWVDFVTPVDRATSHSLIDSLGIEVVVEDGARTTAVFGLETMGVDDALRQALHDQIGATTARVFDLAASEHGVYAMHEHAEIGPSDVDEVTRGLRSCGGDLSWYGLAVAWRLRIALGRPFGERLALHRPASVVEGARVDWWVVADVDASTLVLYTDKWFCGEAWLAYRVEGGDEPRIRQVGALRTKGLLGVAYWRIVWPIHLVVFELMAKRQAKVKRAAAR